MKTVRKILEYIPKWKCLKCGADGESNRSMGKDGVQK